MAERRLRILRNHLAPCSLQASPVSAAAASPLSNELKYTVDNPLLTGEQRQFYEDNGYIVVKGLLKARDIERYVERFVELTEGQERIPGLTVMKDVALRTLSQSNEKVVTKIQDFVNDPVMFSYCELPEVTKYVECFTGPDLCAMHTMLINKPPDPGTQSSRHPMHQDLYYFPFRPAERIVCAWTALQHVHRGNGCLVAVPGSHKGELQEHDYPEWQGGVNKMYHGVKGWKADRPRVHLEMGPGDTVFFHPLLLHGSGTNRTTGFRKAISCHYASNSACQYIDVDGTHQEKIAAEVRDLARKRLGEHVDFKYEDIWRFRGRRVKGKPGYLIAD